MHYLRNGRVIPGFESEDIIDASEPIEIDVEQLSADLENAQATILEESNKYSSALEAMDELENTIGDIEVAMESDIDLVTAQLLVNSLNKYSNTLYGKDLQSAGLQSDNPKNVLEAGLLDAKGMLSAVKEFIAKVWQKIKDAFAFVWKKMKDFWAWLTGSNKKVEEKLEETIVATATIKAAEAKKEDIKKAEEDIRTNKNPDDYLKRFRKRQNYSKASRAGKLDTNEDGTIADIKDGKFKGRKIADLSVGEFNEWMAEGKSNQDIIIDVAIEDIITEEVTKTTGLDEARVSQLLIPQIAKHSIFLSMDKNNINNILKIVNESIKNNSEDLSFMLATLLQYKVKTDVKISPKRNKLPVVGAVKAYRNYMDKEEDRIKYDTEKSLLDGISDFQKTMPSVLISLKMIDSAIGNSLSERISKMALNAFNFRDYVNFISPYLETDVIADANEMIDVSNVNSNDGFDLICSKVSPTLRTVTYFSPFGLEIANDINVDMVAGMKKIVNKPLLASDLLTYSAPSKKDFSDKQISSLVNNLEVANNNLIHEVDLALKALEKSRDTGTEEYRTQRQSLFGLVTKLSTSVQYYSPKELMDSLVSKNKYLNFALDTIDINGAIIQATKEGK